MKKTQGVQILCAGIFLIILLSSCSEWKNTSQSTVDLSTYMVGFYDSLHGISVGYNGKVFYSEDGGKNWTAGSNFTACRFGLEFIDSDTSIHCGNGGNVAVTKDGGKLWERVTDFGYSEPGQCRYLSFSDAKNGWIASPDRLAATSDLGISWNECVLPRSIDKIKAINVWSADEGCLLDNSDHLFFTTDGGITWRDEPLTGINQKLDEKITMAPSTAMRFSDENHGIIITQGVNGKERSLIKLKTNDGGRTWEQSTIPVLVNEGSTVYLSRDTKTLTVFTRGIGVRVFTRASES